MFLLFSFILVEVHIYGGQKKNMKISIPDNILSLSWS